MKILLTGASGFIGRNLTRLLAAHGHALRPVSRRHGLDMSRMTSPEDWQPWLEGIDGVVNAVGIIGETRGQRFDLLHTQAPVALFEACRLAGIRRVVQISALGADETAVSAYHLSKRAADEALLRLDLPGTVLRPSLIYGRGGTSAAMLLRVAALPLVPVLEAGGQILQPVHISDVVATILRVLTGPLVRGAFDIVGPQAMPYSAWMQSLRASQGLPQGRLLPIPVAVAGALSRLLRGLHPLAGPDTLQMLRQLRPADGRAAEELLGRPLLPPAPHLQFEDASILWRPQ